jgi:hypothetical protein
MNEPQQSQQQTYETQQSGHYDYWLDASGECIHTLQLHHNDLGTRSLTAQETIALHDLLHRHIAQLRAAATQRQRVQTQRTREEQRTTGSEPRKGRVHGSTTPDSSH